MRLQRQISRQIDGNEYAKWVIIVPPSQIEELGWQEGFELESLIKGGTLIIRPDIRPRDEKPKRMSYEQFKTRIMEVLKMERGGMSWTEIRDKLGFPQKVPNNLWVRMMEKDIGLVRTFDSKTAKTIWRLRASGTECP